MTEAKKTSSLTNLRWGLVGIIVLGFAAAAFSFPAFFNKGIQKLNQVGLGLPQIPEKNFQLGLDLQGGAHLVYEANVDSIPDVDRNTAVDGVRDVIERRVNGLGVGETNIQTTQVGDKYRIIVELPGVTDVKQAIALIGETPILEFKEQNTVPPRELTAEEQKDIDSYNANAKKEATDVLKKLKGGQDFGELVKQYSEDEASKNNAGYLNFVSKNTFYPEVITWAEKNKEGDISKDLVVTADGYNILKRGSQRDGEMQVSAQHILICYFGAEDCKDNLTKEQAKQKADEIFKEANAENFADLAKKNSTDLGSKDKGGDLGAFQKGEMVPAFEEAAFAAKVGEIVGPVETAYGYHIIYKTAEDEMKEYEVSRILIRTRSAADVLPAPEPWTATALSGRQLEKAQVVTDQRTSAIQVSLQFDEEGAKLFQELTRKNVGKPIAIFLDGSPISIPNVNQEISGGQAVITGTFNIQEAKLLAQRLNTGALPVPVELVSQQTVGASLGAESLAKSLNAGIIGLILVMIFMTLYYRLPGFIAVIALTMYVSLTLSISKLLGVTLTLSGITGLILSIGMAVDANILIFERLKEELRAGKSLKGAVNEGFARAWTSIYDGNVATIITALLLLVMGVSFVKGFAFTLIIGTLVSMFTAVTVTHVLLQFVVDWFQERNTFLFLGSRNTKE